MQKSYIHKPAELKRNWYLVDAKDQILGRLATQIATKLIGKHKKVYTPNLDCGDFVVVINAQDIKLTGKKETDKIYYWHTGYVGGLKQRTVAEQRAKDATQIIHKAVLNMLPKNKLRDGRMARLKIYKDAKHPHNSQFTKK